MRSNDRSEALDLERDLPTSAADVEALRRARTLQRLDLLGYLQFLAQLPATAVVDPRRKHNQSTDSPFELRS